MSAPKGVGLGLRKEVAEDFLSRTPKEVAFIEIHPENYMKQRGFFSYIFEKTKNSYPVLTHGLTMSFGNVDPFDTIFLHDLKRFLKSTKTAFHSDHLCFSSYDGVFIHDLLPIPFHESSLDTVIKRFNEARDILDIELAFENISYYVSQSKDPLDEAHFCAEVIKSTQGKMLLDVNNVYVNSLNFGFDPKEWIDLIPCEHVIQLHIAGHYQRSDGIYIDHHGDSICEEVYDLLRYTLNKTGPIALLLERDTNIPSLDILLDEVRSLNQVYMESTQKTSIAQAL